MLAGRWERHKPLAARQPWCLSHRYGSSTWARTSLSLDLRQKVNVNRTCGLRREKDLRNIDVLIMRSLLSKDEADW